MDALSNTNDINTAVFADVMWSNIYLVSVPGWLANQIKIYGAFIDTVSKMN